MKTDVASLAPSCLGLETQEGTSAARRGRHAYARQLARIEAALTRMETGRYGFCLTCDGRIGLNRLEADPAEAVCETCDLGEDAQASADVRSGRQTARS